MPLTFDFEAPKHYTADFKYNNTTKNLALTIDDVGDASTAPITYNFTVDIPQLVGGIPGAPAGNPIGGSATAYVGFTGATGGEDAEMDIFKFSYTPRPVVGATVSAVYVRGSSWLGADADPNTETFKEYLQDKGLGNSTYGYKVFDAAGTNNASDIIPWINVDEIVVQFANAPSGSGIPTSGMVFTGVKQPYTVTSVTQLDPKTYVLHLDKVLGGGGTTASNGDKVRVKIPGGGTGGSDSSTILNVVQGDVNKSTSVLANDFSEVKARFFKTTKSAVTGTNDYSAFHDVDGSGSILANDFSAVKARFFQILPAANPVSSDAGVASVGATEDLFASTPIL